MQIAFIIFIIGLLLWAYAALRLIIRLPKLETYYQPFTQTDYEIKEEFCRLLRNIGFGSDVLGIVGSWKDSMDDEDTLNQLQHLNDRVEGYGLHSVLLRDSDTYAALICHIAVSNEVGDNIKLSQQQRIDALLCSTPLNPKRAAEIFADIHKTNNGGC